MGQARGLPQNSGPSPPAGATAPSLAGRRATSRRPRATEPAWRKWLGAVHGGAAPGHAQPPAPAPGRPQSLPRPLEPTDLLQAPQLRDGAAARHWLTHQKGSLKGSSHLWAALAARGRSQDLKPGCWRLAWGGHSAGPWGTAAGAEGAESESAVEGLGALSSFLTSTCVPPGPIQSVPGPPSQSSELETWPGPCLSSQPNLTLLGADVPGQGPPNLLPATPSLESQCEHQQGPSRHLTSNCLPPARASTTLGPQHRPGVASRPAAGGGGRSREAGAETQEQGADLLPGARALVQCEGSLPAAFHHLARGKSLGGLCPERKPPSHSEGGGGTLWKAGTCLQLERSRDTGTTGTCGLQRLTRSQSNLTQDSDRGMCPSTDAWTDRQKSRGRPHSTDTGSGSACAKWRRRTPTPSSPPRLGGQRSLARRAGPLTSRLVAEAVPQMAGQERSGRRVSQQTNRPASSLTRAGGAVVCLGGLGFRPCLRSLHPA